jgi:hypothetical protein
MPHILVRFAFTGFICVVQPSSAAQAHEVTVYSFVTADGRKTPAATSEQPAGARLVAGGLQQIGGPPTHHLITPSDLARVAQPLGGALGAHGFQLTTETTSTEHLIVFHCGFAYPTPVDPAGNLWHHEKLEMLTLVGGRALSRAVLEAERAAIFQAAGDERYFVVVSAYDYAVYAKQGTKRLLWRTQMSVPSHGLMPEQAWPMLVTAGAPLFGRDTPLPRRIEIKVTGQLRPHFKPPTKQTEASCACADDLLDPFRLLLPADSHRVVIANGPGSVQIERWLTSRTPREQRRTPDSLSQAR